ncbi:TPA: beta-1,6-N-acetylglucosaminyltransferase, partial [Klebsiella pneumoniae]
ADEVIFHTAIKHLGREDIFHDENYINDALRYIDWVSGPEYPKILNEEDVDKIKKSNCIFARKFPHDIASELFYKIIE